MEDKATFRHGEGMSGLLIVLGIVAVVLVLVELAHVVRPGALHTRRFPTTERLWRDQLHFPLR